MSITGQGLITAEEFARMSNPADGSRQELVRGEVVTMPSPGGLHGVVCSRVNRRVGNFVDQHQLGILTSNDAGFITGRNPDSVRGPDVAYWSRDRLQEVPEGYISVAPDLAVEVLSPEDRFSRLQRKIIEYLASGVRLLWVIDPVDRSIGIYRPDQPLPRVISENETLSGEDVLPGFSCLARELFP